MNTKSPQQNPLTEPAMEAALELLRRGLVQGRGEEVARVIDQRCALPALLDTLMDLLYRACEESDAQAFQRYVLDRAYEALVGVGCEYSYVLGDDGTAYTTLYERLTGVDGEPATDRASAVVIQDGAHPTPPGEHNYVPKLPPRRRV